MIDSVTNGNGLSPEHKLELRKKIRPWLYGLLILLAINGAFAYFLADLSRDRLNDRVVARYVLCRELESLKRAERRRLGEEIRDNETFLRTNPNGIPGVVSRSDIQRSITRKRNNLEEIAPYPRGCVAFARDPNDVNVRVPDLTGA